LVQAVEVTPQVVVVTAQEEVERQQLVLEVVKQQVEGSW
jgi:hypothetical protein